MSLQFLDRYRGRYANVTWLAILVSSSVVSTLLLFFTVLLGNASIPSKTRLKFSQIKSNLRMGSEPLLPKPPALAISLTGSAGDGPRMKRLLKAVYHPKNEYLLHLERDATPSERADLSKFIKLDPTFVAVENVHMVEKPNLITYRGSTMTATYLHCAAIFLKKRKDWDWFINLSASDYPLLTPDDLLHVFSYLPRDLNFIEHTSHLDWKVNLRARPIMIDPGIFLSTKKNIFFTSQRKAAPTAYTLFEGSAWVVLTREFMEYTIVGWENLPRLLLMFYTNYVSSPEGYFHSVICNSPQFINTTVNHDMRFVKWDNPPKQHPLTLNISHYGKMLAYGAPFARKFPKDAKILDIIDRELLKRKPGRFVPGGWCVGEDDNDKDPCWLMGDPNLLTPGSGAMRLQKLILELLSQENFRPRQCRK